MEGGGLLLTSVLKSALCSQTPPLSAPSQGNRMCCIMFSVTCLSAPFSPTHISATEWYCTHYFSRTTKAWQTPSTLPKLHTEPRTAVLSSLTVVNLATDAHQPDYSPLMTAQRNTDLALGHRLRPIVYAPGSIPRSHNLCPGHYTRGNIILFAFTDGCQKTSHSLHTGEYHTVWRLHKENILFGDYTR